MNALSKSWRSIVVNYKQGGLRQLAAKTFRRAGQWSFSRHEWLIYACEPGTYRRSPKLELECRSLDFEALCAHSYFKADLFPEYIRQRLADDSVCHGFFLDAKLANVAWTRRNELEVEPGLTLAEENSVCIYDCFTDPAFRGRGVYTDSLIRLLRSFQEDRFSRVLIAVAPDNPASIKGIERAGFQPWQRVTLVRRFGRRTINRLPFEKLIFEH